VEKSGCNMVRISMVNMIMIFLGSSVVLNDAGNVIVNGSPQTGDSSKRGGRS